MTIVPVNKADNNTYQPNYYTASFWYSNCLTIKGLANSSVQL
jgi:hypothetical protein